MELVSLNTPVIIFNKQLLQPQKPESPKEQSPLFSSSSSSTTSHRLCSISLSKSHPQSSSLKAHFAPMALSKNHKGDTIFVPNEQDALQRHVAFFDRNHDGVIYPWETFQGFRAIGCGIALSLFGAVFINVGLSSKTRSGKYPKLLFPIEVINIHKAKHGSDSGVYDNEGRFVPAKFEELFAKHAHTHPNALTSDELMGMLKANREPKDYKGWVGAYSEWKILYMLCKDKKGLLHKDTIKGVYDGSLFEKMEKDRLSSLKKG